MALKRGRHITLTGIVAGLTAVGGIITYSIDWAIKTQDRLGESQSQRDSLTVAVQILDRRVAKLERRLKLKGGRTVLLNHEPPQGLARENFPPVLVEGASAPRCELPDPSDLGSSDLIA